jgi:hypothetical protein
MFQILIEVQFFSRTPIVDIKLGFKFIDVYLLIKSNLFTLSFNINFVIIIGYYSQELMS